MMAVDLHDCELLLPSQFFTDGLSLEKSDRSNHSQFINPTSSNYSFGSSDSGSELDSSVGFDQLSSISTESSEEGEDYIGELTRQMAQYMLQDDDKYERSWGLAGSPLTPVFGDFEKMKISEETTKNKQIEDFLSSNATIQVSRRNLNAEFQSKQALIEEQIKAIQFNTLKPEQAMKQMEQKPKTKQNQSKGRVVASNSNNSRKAKHHQQQQQQQQQLQTSNQQGGSELRAVFLDASGSRNGSGGTGVFLPRGIGTPCESRKKQGCATVLIPERVVQALKLHFEKTGAPSMFNGGFPLEHDGCVSGKKKSIYSQQKHQSKTVPAMNHQEIGLPQEWTY